MEPKNAMKELPKQGSKSSLQLRFKSLSNVMLLRFTVYLSNVMLYFNSYLIMCYVDIFNLILNTLNFYQSTHDLALILLLRILGTLCNTVNSINVCG